MTEADEARDASASDPRSLHQEILRRIASLEEAMAQLSSHPGVGHNRPPEPIEPVPFGDRDWDVVENAIAVLKAQVSEPGAPPVEALKAAEKLGTIGERLKAYVTKQADAFVSEAVKAAGQETGKWGVRLPLWAMAWAMLADRLIAVSRAVHDWLSSLGVGF